MTNLTQTQIDLLRTRPHNTKLWLSIYNPNTVLSCQITGTAAKGDRVLNYYSDSGDYLDINDGMTMYVGLSAGDASKGKIRVRSATSGSITVAENSHILWEEDDYLTIVDFYEINAVYPRIIQDPGDPTNTLWYKDYDITYTNQNTILGTFICMGSHYAGFTEDTVYYSATGTTHVVSGTSLSYHWLFDGGDPTGSSLLTPGFVTYSTPGHYTTELIVSGSNSSVDVSYRHVSIYDRPENGTNNPILKWEMVDLSGDREGGGYTAKIRIHETVLEETVRNGALVVIFADDWYNYQKISIGGNQENRERILFSGYIVNGSIKYNYKSSFIEFEVASPTVIMQNTEGFSVSVTDSTNPAGDAASRPDYYPSAWALVKNLDIKNGIYHYLRWHSTALKCCDFQFLASDRYINGQDFDRSSIYDAINTLISGALLGRVVSDRQGKVWLEREIYAEPTTYSTNTFLLNKQDWMDEPYIEERQTEEVSYLEIGGVAYAGGGGSATPLLCAAPGVAPGYRGSVQRVQGLALSNQTELNTLAGYLYNYWNVKYPELSFKLSGNYRNLDIAPQDRYTITIGADDTPRGSIISIPTFVKHISFVYDPAKEALLSLPTFSQIPGSLTGDTTAIPPGATVDIPVTPPEPEDPPIPEIPPITYPTGSVSGISNNMLFVPAIGGTNGIVDFPNSLRVWNGGPTAGTFNAETYLGILIDPNDNPTSTYGAGIFIVPAGVASVTIYPFVHSLGSGFTIGLYTEAASLTDSDVWGADHYGEVYEDWTCPDLYYHLINPVVWNAQGTPDGGKIISIHTYCYDDPGVEVFILGWKVVFA